MALDLKMGLKMVTHLLVQTKCCSLKLLIPKINIDMFLTSYDTVDYNTYVQNMYFLLTGSQFCSAIVVFLLLKS